MVQRRSSGTEGGASAARKDGQGVDEKLQAGADGAETEQQRSVEEVVER